MTKRRIQDLNQDVHNCVPSELKAEYVNNEILIRSNPETVIYFTPRENVIELKILQNGQDLKILPDYYKLRYKKLNVDTYIQTLKIYLPMIRQEILALQTMDELDKEVYYAEFKVFKTKSQMFKIMQTMSFEKFNVFFTWKSNYRDYKDLGNHWKINPMKKPLDNPMNKSKLIFEIVNLNNNKTYQFYLKCKKSNWTLIVNKKQKIIIGSNLEHFEYMLADVVCNFLLQEAS